MFDFGKHFLKGLNVLEPSSIQHNAYFVNYGSNKMVTAEKS